MGMKRRAEWTGRKIGDSPLFAGNLPHLAQEGVLGFSQPSDTPVANQSYTDDYERAG